MKPAEKYEYKCWCGETFGSDYEAYYKHLNEGHLK